MRVFERLLVGRKRVITRMSGCADERAFEAIYVKLVSTDSTRRRRSGGSPAQQLRGPIQYESSGVPAGPWVRLARESRGSVGVQYGT